MEERAPSTPSLSVSPDLSIQAIHSLSELERGPLATSYRSFCTRLSGFSQLGFSTEWMRVVEPAYTRQGEHLFFLAAFDGPEMVGLAPFVKFVRGRGWTRLRQLRLWGKCGRYVEYPTVSVQAVDGAKPAVVGAVMQALSGPLRGEFDEIALNRVDPADPFVQALCERFAVSQDVDYGDKIHLFGAHQHIDEKLKGENLRRIRKGERGLREAFSSVEFVTVHDPDPELIEELRALHIARQRVLIEEGRPRISFFEDPVENRVTLDMMKVAQERGSLRVYLLRLDGAVVNFWICYGSDGYVQAGVTATAPVPGHKYASSCLWRYMLVEEIETYGTRWVDAMFGSHVLKRKFSNTFHPVRTMLLQNRNGLGSRARLGLINLVRRLKDVD
jgi:hypothetical protein